MERRTVVPSGADSPHYSTVKDAELARFFQAAVPSEIFTRSRADLFNEFDAPLSRIPRTQSAPFLHELTRRMKARDFFSRCSSIGLSGSFPLFEKRLVD